MIWWSLTLQSSSTNPHHAHQDLHSTLARRQDRFNPAAAPRRDGSVHSPACQRDRSPNPISRRVLRPALHPWRSADCGSHQHQRHGQRLLPRAWKPVTKAVHDNQGKIFVQLWHAGRVGHPTNQPNGQLPVSSSATPFRDDASGTVAVTPTGRMPYETPRALELEEIPTVIEDYRQAALNAIDAGFDGVELLAANGYLLEQFLCDSANKRTDKYGSSIENRARLIFEVLDAITAAIPSIKVGIRLTPNVVAMGCTDSNPAETYGYVVDKLNAYDLAYLHVVEPRGAHFKSDKVPESGITSIYRKLYDGVYITSSGFDRAEAIKTVEEGTADAVAFGRDFIATPDLVKRLELDLQFTAVDYTTFYTASGDITKAAEGYTDYPFAESAP